MMKLLLVPNCSNIRYEFYEFSGDLIETVNHLMYQCSNSRDVDKFYDYV